MMNSKKTPGKRKRKSIKVNNSAKRNKEMAMQQVDAEILTSVTNEDDEAEYEVPELPPPLSLPVYPSLNNRSCPP